MTVLLDAHGTQLLIGDGASPELFQPIPRIRQFQGPGGASAIVDVTDFDSTAIEKKAGVADEGQLTFTLVWLPAHARHRQLRLDRAARVIRNFKLVFSDGAIWCFAACVTHIEVSTEVEDVIWAEVTLEITGEVFDCDGLYELHLFVPGTPVGQLLAHRPARSIMFPAGLTGSRGGAETAASQPVRVSFQKNGAEFGFGTILAGATEMSFAGGPAILGPQDTLRIAVDQADATLNDMEVTLNGVR